MKNPSEIIQDFIDLIEKSHEEYNAAKGQVDFYNANTYVWTHKLEDCKNKSERGRLATAWQRELRERRKEKDRKVLWEKIHIFGQDGTNKAMMKRLKYLVQEQRKIEEYVGTPMEEREYKKGAKNEKE